MMLRRILATAGHVDHGKSALIHALTGQHTDRLPEEKKRGITIDLGFAHLTLPARTAESCPPRPAGDAPTAIPTPDTEESGSADDGDAPTLDVGIIDVPGHEDFVKNMVAGVGSIDAALLVIAAADQWMPQTEEHLQIID